MSVPVPMMSSGEAANFSIAGTLMLVREIRELKGDEDGSR